MTIIIKDFIVNGDHVEGFKVSIPNVTDIDEVNWNSVVESIKYDHPNFKKLYEEERA